jgi:hypothetical protein
MLRFSSDSPAIRFGLAIPLVFGHAPPAPVTQPLPMVVKLEELETAEFGQKLEGSNNRGKPPLDVVLLRGTRR